MQPLRRKAAQRDGCLLASTKARNLNLLAESELAFSEKLLSTLFSKNLSERVFEKS